MRYEIEYDTDPESPREWDNLGTMVCGHSRYTLGDIQPKQDPEEYLDHIIDKLTGDALSDLDERLDRIWYGTYRYSRAALAVETRKEKIREQVMGTELIVLPLYLYDHGGITMSTGRFSCPWDSGQVGFIYVTRKDWEKDGMVWDQEKVEACLEAEVKVYDAYLTGQVFGYTIVSDFGEVLDSCWGYYDRDYCETEAKQALAHHVKERQKRKTERYLARLQKAIAA